MTTPCTTSDTFRTLLLAWRGNRSQEYIGGFAGLSGNRLSDFERSVALPHQTYQVIQIAEALGLTPEQLARFLHAYTCDKHKWDGLPCRYCPYFLASRK